MLQNFFRAFAKFFTQNNFETLSNIHIKVPILLSIVNAFNTSPCLGNLQGMSFTFLHQNVPRKLIEVLVY